MRVFRAPRRRSTTFTSSRTTCFRTRHVSRLFGRLVMAGTPRQTPPPPGQFPSTPSPPPYTHDTDDHDGLILETDRMGRELEETPLPRSLLQPSRKSPDFHAGASRSSFPLRSRRTDTDLILVPAFVLLVPRTTCQHADQAPTALPDEARPSATTWRKQLTTMASCCLSYLRAAATQTNRHAADEPRCEPPRHAIV